LYQLESLVKSENKPFLQADFKSVFKKINENKTDTFCSFITQYIDQNKAILKQTQNSHRQTLRIIESIDQHILTSKINYQFITDFHNKLHEIGYAEQTIYKHHKQLKTFIHHAIKTEQIKVNPYQYFSLKRPISTRTNLTDLELSSLETLYTKNTLPALHQNALKVFLFACYTGLRFSDLCKINFITDYNNKVLTIFTIKTNYQLKLPLDLLFDGKAINYIFDKIPNNAAINQQLKFIQQKASINTLLTMHVARHTFLTNLAEKTGNVFTVMQFGGITKVETAMNYIHLAEKKINESLKNVKW